jgi:hypothetical protein
MCMLTSDQARASSRLGRFAHRLYLLRSSLSGDLRLRGSRRSIALGNELPVNTRRAFMMVGSVPWQGKKVLGVYKA